jgi:hypothetical protein
MKYSSRGESGFYGCMRVLWFYSDPTFCLFAVLYVTNYAAFAFDVAQLCKPSSIDCKNK